MGKLNIAHHKSYHPYRRDNIERVRRDEEEARKKTAVEEGRMMLADSEARMDLLRQKAGASRRRDREADPDPQPQAGSSSFMSGGHINLFEDVEQQTMLIAARAVKKAPEASKEGIALAPPEKDLKPWYTDRDHERNKELEDERRVRDLARKNVHDPLTSINHQLSSRSGSKNSLTTPRMPERPQRRPAPSDSQQRPPEVSERLLRESAERQRALELIQRRKREMHGNETPSTVHGGMEGYRDVFNRKEVEEARRNRDRGWDRRDERGQIGRHYQSKW